jgi:cytochrome c oxidase cbb3-type subunit III
MRRTQALVAGIVAIIALAGCEKVADTAAVPVAKSVQRGADHELGRQVYNFRCYYCHGYSGDARTLAASFLNPVPRNFTAVTVAELPRERMIDAITHGRAGTAMKGFAGIISTTEIAAVANFITTEFIHNKSVNTRYHTEANGWREHDRFKIAYPFATGEIALDEPMDSLTAAQKQGKQLFMSSCVSCHDRAKVNREGAAWAIRPVTYPPDYYLLAESGRADEHNGFDPHHAHEKPATFDNLSKIERRGESLYQKNCAFCHAADGTGRNWIGSFIEPNATDLTSAKTGALEKTKLTAVIADGVEGSSMPAWKNVLTTAEIDAVVAYVSRAFAKPDQVKPQRRASL